MSLPIIWLPHYLYGISEYCSKECLRLYKRKISTIYLGTTIFTKSKKKTQRSSKKIRALSVSRLVSYKGFHHIIQAVRNLPITLTIIGSSPNTNYLNYLKSIATSNTKIIINPSDKKLAHFYRLSDIYLSADKFLFFGFPILEAESFSLPVVSLNYAAASEVVLHSKTGLVATNMSEFRSYVIKLIKSASLRQTLGAAGLKHSQTFTWTKTASQLESAYEKVLH
jgi:glycosyltransferase involved in cell wall biosynthesis